MDAPRTTYIPDRFVRTILLVLIGATVFSFQLWLVARAGTDVPFGDQGDVEGRWLYPEWVNGRLSPLLLFRAHNEHHIVFTHLLNLLLFQFNGSWDPLLQQCAGVLLRALCALGLGAFLLRGASLSSPSSTVVAGAIIIAYLPVAAWHNVLWGFQTQVWFSLGFGLFTLWWLPSADRAGGFFLSFAYAVASQLSMGSGLVLAGGALVLLAVRLVASRGNARNHGGLFSLTALILASALLLRKEVPEHAAYHPVGVGDAVIMFVKICGWPFYESPIAAVLLNVPFLALLVTSANRRDVSAQHQRVLALGGWALAMNAAMAWSRGASPEFETAIPARYIDFVVLLPLVNVWSTAWWLQRVPLARRKMVRVLACSWGLVLLIGWFGACAPLWRGIIVPRIRDRTAPVRLAVAYFRNRDVRVFTNQPRLYVPHPDLGSVAAVFNDPSLAGKLPPSFQPDLPLGPGSHGIRFITTHLFLSLAIGWFAVGVGVAALRCSSIRISPAEKSQ